MQDYHITTDKNFLKERNTTHEQQTTRKNLGPDGGTQQPQRSLGDHREEEDDARDNMPESLQNSERYEQSEEASESMESAEEALQEAIGYLESVAEE